MRRLAHAARFLLRSDADTTPLGQAFATERATLFLPWIIGVMVYLALLMVAALLSIDNTISRWRSDLSDRLTVVVPQSLEISGEISGEKALTENSTQDSTQNLTENLLVFLRAEPSVVRAEPIALAHLQSLLEPWLGPAARIEGLPLPTMIEVDLLRIEEATVAALRATLQQNFPRVLLDDHRLWRTRLLAVGRILQTVAFLATLVTLTTALVIVSFGVHAAMGRHATTIQLLRVMGAEDAYITAQFLPAVRRAAAWGSSAGLLLFLSTYALLRVAGQGFAPERMGPYGWQWLFMLLVPLVSFVAALGVLAATMHRRLLDVP